MAASVIPGEQGPTIALW